MLIQTLCKMKDKERERERVDFFGWCVNYFVDHKIYMCVVTYVRRFIVFFYFLFYI